MPGERGGLGTTKALYRLCEPIARDHSSVSLPARILSFEPDGAWTGISGTVWLLVGFGAEWAHFAWSNFGFVSRSGKDEEMSENQEVGLADVPGLGPVRREALAEAGVTDLAGLLAMKVTELAAVRGIGIWQARKVREYLRQEGLLVEAAQTTEPEADQPIIIHAPETAAEAMVVAEVVAVMEAQAEAEAQVEAEVELLSEALEAADVDTESDDVETETEAESDNLEPERETAEETEPESESEDEAEVEDEADAETDDDEEAEDEGEADSREELGARRERLPEVALTLIEAIRQAAVSKQLTRQITRLLITSGEFVSESRTLSPEATQAAADALGQAEALLQRALEKEAFSEKEQRELADRIRKRRKALDRLLERDEVEDR